jgi:hypothetical protein
VLLLALACAAAAEPTGDETLDALLDGMATTSGVEAHFSERKSLALLSDPLTSEGRLYFVPPDRLARFTTAPVGSALIVDGERVRFVADGESPMDLSGDATARQFVENFVVLWSGDAARLRRLYHATLETQASRWKLVLVPRRAPLSHFVEDVVLEGDGPEMQTMTMRDRDGDVTTTRLERVQVDRDFDEAELEQLFTRGRPLPVAESP